MISAVIIEGVTFPVAYNGYTYTRAKIWSKNTGRNDVGDLVGTLVCLKDKVEIQLPPLTGQQHLNRWLICQLQSAKVAQLVCQPALMILRHT